MDLDIRNGFNDLAYLYNFAHNGSFILDTAETYYGNDYLPVEVGSYMCDAWTIEENTISECYLQRMGDSYYIFKGRGKKGQYINIANEIGTGDFSYEWNQIFTTAIRVANEFEGGLIKVITTPRTLAPGYEIYQNSPYVKPSEIRDIVNIHRVQPAQTWDIPTSFTIYLESDGQFRFRVNNFRMLAGGYKNPPKFCPVPSEIEAFRCGGGFSTGGQWVQMLPIRSDSGWTYTHTTIPLHGLTSVPSFGATLLEIILYQDPVDGTGSLNSTANWSIGASDISLSEVNVILTKSTATSTYSCGRFTFSYTIS